MSNFPSVSLASLYHRQSPFFAAFTSSRPAVIFWARWYFTAAVFVERTCGLIVCPGICTPVCIATLADRS